MGASEQNNKGLHRQKASRSAPRWIQLKPFCSNVHSEQESSSTKDQMSTPADQSKGCVIEIMMLTCKCGLEDERDHFTMSRELEPKVGKFVCALQQHGCHLRPGIHVLMRTSL